MSPSEKNTASNNGKIPATIITGFLGAGKTSTIRHLLKNAGGKRLALIINEFGDLGVDGTLLQCDSDSSCSLMELANGCICCTVADDFLPAVRSILDRPDPPDHIIIETSGLALPKPLVQAFAWPEIRTRTTVDGVIALIDAPAVAAGQFAAQPDAVQKQRLDDPALDHDSPLEEVFTDQLSCADVVVLNKTDLLDADARARVEEVVRRGLRAGSAIIPASHGCIPPDVLLGIDAAAEDDLDTRPSLHDGVEEHDHDDFDSFTLTLGPVDSPDRLAAALKEAVIRHHILRVKGIAHVSDRPMRLVIQAVGPRLHHYFDRPWTGDDKKSTRLVVIGQTGMNRAAITADINNALAASRAGA